MEKLAADYIAKLEQLQKTMPSFEELVSAMHGTFVQYELEKGFAIGYGLLHESDCAVQKYFATADTHFPPHVHDEYEYFIVIQGEGEVSIDGQSVPFKAKDWIVIEPGKSHSWHYATPVKMIAVTVPASEGFPHGKG